MNLIRMSEGSNMVGLAVGFLPGGWDCFWFGNKACTGNRLGGSWLGNCC